MTYEDAVEQLLQSPTIACHCSLYPVTVDNIGSCADCHGYGEFLRDIWLEAATLLEKEVPSYLLQLLRWSEHVKEQEERWERMDRLLRLDT